jgi:hypothetical protein
MLVGQELPHTLINTETQEQRLKYLSLDLVSLLTLTTILSSQIADIHSIDK